VFYDGRKKMLRMLQNGKEKSGTKEEIHKKEKITSIILFFNQESW
jgi:hypothetical protein